MSRIPALSAAVVMLLSACAAPAPQVDLAAEEQAVRAVSAQWLAFDGAKDAAGIAGLFADDGVMYREDQEPIVGPAAVQAQLATYFAERSQLVSNFTTDRVEVAPSGDLAVEHGTWTDSGPDGDDQGWYATVYRKAGGEWKVVSDMALSTKPAAAAAPADATAAQ